MRTYCKSLRLFPGFFFTFTAFTSPLNERLSRVARIRRDAFVSRHRRRNPHDVFFPRAFSLFIVRSVLHKHGRTSYNRALRVRIRLENCFSTSANRAADARVIAAVRFPAEVFYLRYLKALFARGDDGGGRGRAEIGHWIGYIIFLDRTKIHEVAAVAPKEGT